MEIRHLTEEYIGSLITLQKNNKKEFEYFTPHQFTRDALKTIIDNAKLDLFYVVVLDCKVIGYGILRGLDDDYGNFSLGIAIDEKYYGTGLSVILMSFLEFQAKLRGHSTIRLRVFNDNKRAYNFYQELGYVYGRYDDNSVVGIKEL